MSQAARYTLAMLTRSPTRALHRRGSTIADLRENECPEQFATAVFDDPRVIEWYRQKEFQLLSLLQIAEQLLCASGTRTRTSWCGKEERDRACMTKRCRSHC